MPASYSRWKRDAQKILKASWLPTFKEGPVWFEIRAVWPCPKSASKIDGAEWRWRDQRPDIDNVAKSVLDAANGILFSDDAQIASLKVHKVIAPAGVKPRIDICFGALEGTPL